MFGAVSFYRVANFLYRKRIPFLPKVITYCNRLLFACWLPYSAKLGKNVMLGYGGLGVVIHSDAEIGDNVHIDQGVTIGGNAREFGVPKIGNNVYIGCGAKILGPIKIGNGSVIGANAVVIDSVLPNCVVAGVPAKIIHKNINIKEYLYHLKKRMSN